MGVGKPSDPPGQYDLEISLLGGGNGYGESVLIHLGDDVWVVVDSLLDPKSKENLPLAYLDSIGVDPAESVKLIVASHWHKDHIAGLADIVSACSKAEFSSSVARENSMFLTLVSLDKHISNPTYSGVREFRHILDNVLQSKRPLKNAIEDRLLLAYKRSDGVACEVWALSPSDDTLLHFESKFGELIKKASDGKAITVKAGGPGINDTSVVLLIKVGETHVLLGADLEVTPSHPTRGWHAVMASTKCPKGNEVEVFKIPHHGSENGYHQDVWDRSLLKDNPLVALTSYAPGKKKLPEPKEVKKILDHSENAFITSSPHTAVRPGGKKRSQKAMNAIRGIGLNIKELKFHYGHVRLRKKTERTRFSTVCDSIFGSQRNRRSALWEVNLYGEAKKLSALPLPGSKC